MRRVRPYTRRATLAALGAAVLAGCTDSTDGDSRSDFWDDPPPFDDAGLDDVTDASIPDPPDPVPVTVSEDWLASFETTVDDLLDLVPEPLTAEILPNGELRAQIEEGRADARDALDALWEVETVDRVADAVADAFEPAGTAAGTWAAVSDELSFEDVMPDVPVSDRLDETVPDLPGPAVDPTEGTVVYGTIEDWIRDLSSGFSVQPESADDPLRAGQAVGTTFRRQARVDAAIDVHDRYVESLDEPMAIDETLDSAVTTIGAAVQNRVLRLHDEDDPEDPLYYLPVEDLLEEDPPRDEPGVRLLSNVTNAMFDPMITAEPLAWPDWDVSEPALAIVRTHWFLAMIDAIEALAVRIDAGDDLFPPDAATVRSAREDAIDRVDDLVAADSPLTQSAAVRRSNAFGAPDESFDSETVPELQDVTSAYGRYVWIEAVAEAVPAATALVEDAFDA